MARDRMERRMEVVKSDCEEENEKGRFRRCRESGEIIANEGIKVRWR